MSTRIVYADNAATTQLSDTAFDEMTPYFKEFYGNPSAAHSYGAKAKTAVENSRKRIATDLGAQSNELFFTSGGTESDNWALYSALNIPFVKGHHIITTRIEHSAIFRAAKSLEEQGCDITYLPVDRYGQISPAQLAAAIRSDTALVSIMLANNEIGTILPIMDLCNVAHKKHVRFHTDAVQAVGHIPVNVKELGVDMLSISAHKFRGPKGIGALYIKNGCPLPPLLIGGGQEKHKRSGTENVPAIVGMAAALDEAVSNMDRNMNNITIMRDRLIKEVLSSVPDSQLTGDPHHRLPGTASFVFGSLKLAPLVAKLSEVGICASSGSACSSGSTELSRALAESLNTSAPEQYGALRLTLNECNTTEDVDYIVGHLPEVIAKLRTSRFGL